MQGSLLRQAWFAGFDEFMPIRAEWEQETRAKATRYWIAPECGNEYSTDDYPECDPRFDD
jgi:hypothetical protein